MRYLEAGVGGIALILSWGLVCIAFLWVVRLMFPKSPKAESIAFWMVLAATAVLLSGVGLDGDFKWNRR